MVHGFRVLGSVIGTPSACDKYMENEFEKRATLNENLSKIAKTSPHVPFCQIGTARPSGGTEKND